MSVIQLLHGTDHIIEVPDIHIGNPHNDYGMGFYCTRVDEMAREWACKKNTDGFVNSYDFDTEGLKVLNLLDGTHTVLNWMALFYRILRGVTRGICLTRRGEWAWRMARPTLPTKPAAGHCGGVSGI